VSACDEFTEWFAAIIGGGEADAFSVRRARLLERA